MTAPDPTTLRSWLDTLMSAVLGQKTLPDVFSPDGVPRVAVDLPTLRQLHDLGRTALAVLQTRVAALTPAEGTVLAIHVQEAQLPQEAVQAALGSLEHALTEAGWDPLPHRVAFGPQMELRWLTEEQISWLRLKQQAEIDTLTDQKDALRQLAGELWVAVDEARKALPDDQKATRTYLAQTLNHATGRLTELDEL